MKFFKQRTSDLTAVASNTTFETPQLFRGVHQVTISTFDSGGNSVAATGGTFSIQYKGGPIAQIETLKNDAGTDLSIDATALESILFEGNVEEVVIVPSSIATATHYRVTLTQGE